MQFSSADEILKVINANVQETKMKFEQKIIFIFLPIKIYKANKTIFTLYSVVLMLWSKNRTVLSNSSHNHV